MDKKASGRQASDPEGTHVQNPLVAPKYVVRRGMILLGFCKTGLEVSYWGGE